MRVLHLSVMRNLTGGQRKQLHYETIAAQASKGVVWDTIAIHDNESKSSFEVRTPYLFRRQILRNLYGWLFLRRVCKDYDLVLMRHLPFDVVGALMSRFVSNRGSVHHSREVEEIVLIRHGLLGKILSRLELLVGGLIISRSRVVLGVTNEIAAYEVNRSGSVNLVSGAYPNTIIPECLALASDLRDCHLVQAAFVCGKFSAWHGLDILIDSCKKDDLISRIRGALVIHLVGNLGDHQLSEINLVDPEGSVFRVHGYLSEKDYRHILDGCDVGIGSLALSRQGMSEGSTLKMCELLGMGIPVYSAEPDVVLPVDFPYSFVDRHPSLPGLVDFGIQMKTAGRNEVRQAALSYIDKASWVRSVIPLFERVISPVIRKAPGQME